MTFQSPHQHRLRQGAALASAARDVLIAAGEKWTDLRAAVFQTLVTAAHPVSAYDVADAVGSDLGRRIAANSVYRILDLFVENNLVVRIESRNAYLANAHPSCRHDCLFFLCDSCDAVVHVDDDRFSVYLRDMARKTGFSMGRSILEVLGRCSSCADDRQSRRNA